MSTLTITLPQRKMRQVEQRARAAGFRAPGTWARSIIETEVARDEDDEEITEDTILRWSREAKVLKRAGKLPILRSLADLRSTRRGFSGRPNTAKRSGRSLTVGAR
ncbi:MAG: hypothetical protein Q8R39_01505 [bacterium]|nr:hypothetical protein [bacterium]MDZ4284946.1 hypothetical protein [Patescibacteria group bacterium]